MSHELSIRADGKVEMAYLAGTEVPWHTLGNTFGPDASLDEIVTAAGMDFRLLRGFVRYATGRDQDSTQWATMDDKVVIFRGDNKKAMGVVSDSFQLVQPRTVVEMVHEICQTAGLTMNTAGVLFDGRRFWALADIGAESFVADKADAVKRHLLITTACDGTMATMGSYTDTRVVCNNTLSASMRRDMPKVRITHRSKLDAAKVREELGVDKAAAEFGKAMADFRRLAETRIDGAAVLAQTMELVSPGYAELDSKKQDKILRSKPVQAIGMLASGRAMGSAMDGAHGTQWGWLNAVTQYVDHDARATSIDNRLNSAWFGRGNDLKTKAMEMAMVAADGSTVSYVPGWQHVDTTSDDSHVVPGLLDGMLEEAAGK